MPLASLFAASGTVARATLGHKVGKICIGRSPFSPNGQHGESPNGLA
jgi:hypothetical protein